MSRKRLSQILLALLGILLLALLGLGTWAVVTVRQPFPDTDGRETVAGLSAPVDIYRDEFGVPHIYAETDADLYFAQGYVHAQDRFWQMEFARRAGQGELSALVGAGTLDSDKFIRTVGWNRLAADAVEYYQREAPDFYASLEAYAAGVNSYMEANEGHLALDYRILQLVGEPAELEPWKPIDTISWAIVMANDLSGNWRQERQRAELIRDLGEARVATLTPGYPYEDRPVVVPTEKMDYLDLESDGADPPADEEEESDEPEEEENEEPADQEASVDWSRVNTDLVGDPLPHGLLFGSGTGIGSNNWVVSGEHTASGLPLLANDPHLGIRMPSIWYEIGLHTPEHNVVGFSFSGVPGVIIGHNDHIAWGVTNVGPDVQDLFIEKINPSNPRQYEYRGEWEEMEIVEEVIEVAGGEDVLLEVKITRHGPIINDVVDGASDVLAFRWTAQEPNRILQSVLLLNKAEDWDDFREALRYWDLPSQNVVYADVEGNIGYQMPGLIPIRANGNGLIPVPGWTGEHEWEGWIPYDDLPRAFNPEEGYIVTANHAVIDQDYPYYLDTYWADGDRGQRITDLLEEAIDQGPVTVADMANIQFDSYSLLADSYIPLFEGLSSDDPAVQEAIERLRGWDRQLRRDSVPAAIFEVWFRELTNEVLADDVGEDNVNTLRSLVLFHDLAEQPAALWWDDTTTDAQESQEEIMLRALEKGVVWLEENVGEDSNQWTWGTLHTATFVNNPLGQSGTGIIEGMVNRGPYPVDGGRSIVNASSYNYDEMAEVTGVPSMRMIVNMADFDASQTIHTTGQSGHPYHRHYDDMIQLWADGEYHRQWFSREAVEEAAVDHLILEPPE